MSVATPGLAFLATCGIDRFVFFNVSPGSP
jgi:hypothetical protein